MKISLRDMTKVSLFAALMVVGAFIRVPTPFLPVTFQGFFCALAGVLLGAKLGLASQLIYILMGLAGLPVFSEGGGVTYLVKPSFGYLLGFAAAAFVIGAISEKIGTVNLINTLFSLFCGLLVIYAIGMGYSYLISKVYLGKPNAVFVSMAIVPFLIKDAFLFLGAGIVVSKVSQQIKHNFKVLEN